MMGSVLFHRNRAQPYALSHLIKYIISSRVIWNLHCWAAIQAFVFGCPSFRGWNSLYYNSTSQQAYFQFLFYLGCITLCFLASLGFLGSWEEISYLWCLFRVSHQHLVYLALQSFLIISSLFFVHSESSASLSNSVRCIFATLRSWQHCVFFSSSTPLPPYSAFLAPLPTASHQKH